jgi:hypothetical protein
MALDTGSQGGYRIFYKAMSGKIAILRNVMSSLGEDGSWDSEGILTPDASTGVSISAGFVKSGDITVVMPSYWSSRNYTIEVCTSKEKEWAIGESP